MQNIKKSVAIFSILIVLILSIGTVSAAEDSGDVLTNESSGGYVYNDENNFTDIQQAIYNANESDTIYLNQSYCPATVEQNDHMVVSISKPINLVGVENYTMIDAGLGVGAFEIVNTTVLLKNIHFTNTEGCAVAILNSNVTFENCMFSDNYGNFGPAVSIFNNELHLSQNQKISLNRSPEYTSSSKR